MTKETQKMIVKGQKFNTQKKYLQTMGVFEDWMKEKNYTVQDIMNQKIPFIHTEFMTWLIKTRKTKPSSAKHHASILNTMFSLIFGTVQVSTTVQRLTTLAISDHQINNPRYGSTWDINQLFEHWRERPESKLLSNEEQQTKLASQLMSQCYIRMEEIANIDLSVSIIDDEEHTAALFVPLKQSRKRQTYDVRKTEEPKKWEQADQNQISARLERLVQTLGVQNATTNSIKHASSTELTAQGFDGRTINYFIHHTPDSKMNKKFYIFAVNKEQDSIASALVKNHSEKQTTQIISKQGGGARVSKGDGLQQFPLAQSPNYRESAQAQKSQIQKDDQAVEPQDEAQDPSMTKDSDRATTAESQKQ
ncbi:MAG: hypothetical protein EZS28_008439 [Streblomastix strix]|uniref:Uncharacterized protein n=1 Tax=Streblomastix strix TaxID=222440 RepID=A0A5J4WLT2_9EUKA|nr:MAG: hypothetical protein EZS28_008439 [Streblomastix strix]